MITKSVCINYSNRDTLSDISFLGILEKLLSHKYFTFEIKSSEIDIVCWNGKKYKLTLQEVIV